MSCSGTRPFHVNSPIDVVIVDDADEIRSMLGLYFSLDPRMAVVAEGGSGLEAISLAQRRRPAVMILDVMMPDGSGIEALPLVKRASPATKVIIYSAQSASTLRQAATEAGADGYLEKSAPLAALTDMVIDLVAFGQA